MTRIRVTALDPDLGHVIVTKTGTAKVLAVHDLTHMAVRNVTVSSAAGGQVVWGYTHDDWVEILDGEANRP